MKKILFLAFLLITYLGAFAQAESDKPVTKKVDDFLQSSDKIYVVVVCVVIIFIGLAIYLFSIDRRLKKIEKEK